MKKVIVTRENYEEVMFDLLENNYPTDVRENILEQIHADTFLNFEWQQWSKATYSESTELYKSTEAEFLESLTKEEEKRKGMLYYIIPMAIAASILLFIGVYFFSNQKAVENPGMVHTVNPGKAEEKRVEIIKENPAAPIEKNNAGEFANKAQAPRLSPPLEPINPNPIIENRDTVMLVEKQKEIQPEVPTFQDSINSMIASAQKKPRYKITIVEGQADAVNDAEFRYDEKRYSMADVMKHKDGISLSKFLDNPNSRIVTDKLTNKVTIEYVAADHSVLVLTLSN